MTNRIKTVIAIAMTLLLLLAITSCGVLTPYDKYDNEGYSVSVKYDANGGSFTTNTTVITDTARLDDLKTNGDGMKELPLISPSDPVRGSGNAFTPIKSGYFLAGWYTERTPVTDNDENVLDIDGGIAKETGKEVAYTYSGRWNFGDKYLVDPDKTYTASEPVLTLYAAWVPEFSYDFYNADGTELLGSVTFNPTLTNSINLPAWDLTQGTLNWGGVPMVNGKTYVSLSTEVGGEAYVGDTLTHTGVFNAANATAEGGNMKLYLELAEGTWYRISTAQQFTKNASASGCYYIEADLDFGGKWTSAFQNAFTGKIVGNDHKFTNISAKQAGSAKNNALFGQITKDASITDLVIEGASYTVNRGSTTAGATFALLAGVVAEGAVLDNVKVEASKLIIEANYQLYFPQIYSFGLIIGQGYDNVDVDYSGVTLETVETELGSKVYYVTTVTNGNTVTVKTGNRDK